MIDDEREEEEVEQISNVNFNNFARPTLVIISFLILLYILFSCLSVFLSKLPQAVP